VLESRAMASPSCARTCRCAGCPACALAERCERPQPREGPLCQPFYEQASAAWRRAQREHRENAARSSGKADHLWSLE